MDRMLRLYGLLQSTKKSSGLNRVKTFTIIGSTGFLGPHIIASLLRAHPDSSIYCLNRSDNARQRTQVAAQKAMGGVRQHMDRLDFSVSDLTQSMLGLGPKHSSMLATDVDELIFNSWDPNWVKELAYFEPFLKDIRNAIDFCATASKRPRLSFMSSICVVGDWPLYNPTDPAILEDVILDSRCAMPHGYGDSTSVC
jgi:thioester reductase-like protein